jgi:nicotinate-nucleotide pyrophosphorylase (carboxylating)
MDGVDHILLDNMSLDDLREAVSARGDRGTPMLEASGGVTLATLRDIAETGVDFIPI